MFVAGVECGFLRVYKVMCELFEGMHLYTVVIVMYRVARVLLSLLINNFILCVAVIQRVVLIAVVAL